MASCPCIRAVRITTPDLGWIKKKNMFLKDLRLIFSGFPTALRVEFINQHQE